MKTRILLFAALFIGGAVFGEPLLDPRPFTMHVVDRAGRAVSGVRIVTDNGIVCFSRLDGDVSWSESSLMRRAVRFSVQDDRHRFDDVSATLHFTRGGRATVTVDRASRTR